MNVLLDIIRLVVGRLVQIVQMDIIKIKNTNHHANIGHQLVVLVNTNHRRQVQHKTECVQTVQRDSINLTMVILEVVMVVQQDSIKVWAANLDALHAARVHIRQVVLHLVQHVQMDSINIKLIKVVV